ncbi:hypothetical protein [Rhodococcoides kroppenstedtii]|uniref:hypothetical protein n=1 Tax=Rhodococcoides kroppenstedtii TaxID=293050 RepID=UPI001BDF3EFF|nr:hypothetical protein [Rhodococcus kroppenstedtii]MBT1191012.1 hypothetical protein [Rhodococcus kroppenstedtii]
MTDDPRFGPPSWHPESMPHRHPDGGPHPHQEGGPPRHPEGDPPGAMPPVPGGPGRPAAEEAAPVDIETARHLWIAVIGLGVASMLVGLWSLWSDRAAFLDALMTDLTAQDPSLALPPETADTVLTVAMGFALLFAAAITALVWLTVRKMRAGKLWARAVLTGIGVVVVVTTLPSLFGLGGVSGTVAVVTTILGILQAVAAAGAVYLMHRRESTEFFVRRRG